MRWFVYKHFKPFPIEAEEAYCRFCLSVDPEAFLRLSPLYFNLRFTELNDPTYMDKEWHLDFYADENPAPTDMAVKCQEVLRSEMQRIMTMANR